jgi:glycerol-3-phosphate dehydrogenase
LLASLRKTYDFIPEGHLTRLAHRHGSRCADVLGEAHSLDDLGVHFGNGLYSLEVDYMREHEWAQTTEDILWRRTKCGLGADPGIDDRLEAYLAADVPRRVVAE